MSEKVKEYSNGKITVVWKPTLCIHSAKCVAGLPEVFRPKEKPWIRVGEASTDELIVQINRCPSGALTYYENDQQTEIKESPMTENQLASTTIDVLKNGPLVVKGHVEIKHADGTAEIKETRCSLCRCGHSANKPYCDGAHRAAGFEG